jgi:hypothetical protein
MLRQRERSIVCSWPYPSANADTPMSVVQWQQQRSIDRSWHRCPWLPHNHGDLSLYVLLYNNPTDSPPPPLVGSRAMKAVGFTTRTQQNTAASDFSFWLMRNLFWRKIVCVTQSWILWCDIFMLFSLKYAFGLLIWFPYNMKYSALHSSSQDQRQPTLHFRSFC